MSSNSMGPLISPISGGTGGTIGKIIKVIKTLIGIFGKPSEQTGKRDSINDNSSLENFDRIIQIFTDFKEQVHIEAVEVEKAVEDEVNYYVEELHDILGDNDGKVTKYGINIKRIERQIDKIASRVKGTIDNELSKKVSLDNLECKEIIKMIPGAKKETAMSDFLKKSVNSALEECCFVIHSSLDEIYDDVETEIIGAVESIQKQTEQLQGSLASIDKDNYEETAKKQMIEAYYLNDICDMVLELL